MRRQVSAEQRGVYLIIAGAVGDDKVVARGGRLRGQAVEHLLYGGENGILRLEHRELDVVCAGCAFQFEPLH